MKKLLTIAFLLCSILQAAADTWTDSNGIVWNYTVNNDGNTVNVKPNDKSSISGDLVIPENMDSYPVTIIANKAFSGCTNLTSVTIPNSVTSIGAQAFYNCYGLTSVTIPNSVTRIDSEAFLKCSGLKKVIVEDLTSWCNISFNNWDANPLNLAHHLYSDENTEITDLVIPNSVARINSYAFYGCTGLTSVTIDDGVTSIGQRAFYGCSGLTSVTIPNSVTGIGYGAFSYCIGLTSVTIPSSVTIIDGDAFFGCSGLTSLTIDNGVTSIGRGAFSNCTGLTSVTIPESVTEILSYAFQDCTGLTSVTIDNSVARIVDYAFQGCSSLTSITLGNNVTSIGREVFMNTGWYNSQSNGILYLDNWLIGYKGTRPSGDLIINDGTKGIAGSAFSGCSSLTSVLIPNSVTSICDAVFYNCSGLTSIEIPNNVMRIGDDAFYGCSGLTSVTVDIETPLTIYNRTFSNRSNATLYVPTGCKAAYEAADYWKNFKQIEEYSPNINFKSMAAKALCVQNWDTNNDGELSKAEAAAVTNLEDVFSESNITSFDELQYFTGLTYINYSAFYNCSLLTSITIPNSVTRILGDAFYDCTGLTAVHISDLAAWCNITNNSNPLNYAHHLYLNGEEVKDLVIPNSVTSIGGSAFQGCSGLTSVTIPESVTSIGSNAFENCTGLTAVHISDLAAWCNITNNSSPLNYAHHLYLNGEEVKDLVIPNSVTTIGAHAFEGCSGLTSVAIPNSVTSIGGSAFCGCTGLTSVMVDIETPLTILNSTFSNRTSATLYVLEGSKAAYEAAEYWQDFIIVEMASSTASVVTAPTPKELTYTGSAQELVTPGEASGGTMQYSLDGMNYSPDIPTGTDVGEYTVYYKVVGDAGHTDTEPATVSVVIVPTNDWFNIVFNSDMEGTNNACFFSRENYFENEDVVPATIVEGAGVNGSRGIVIQSVDNPSESWATQFFIRLPQTIPAGTKYRMSFVCKASQTSSCSTEAHQEPNDFISWGTFGTVNFASDWQHFERTGVISEEQSPADKPMRTIAFNLTGTTTATTYYFDNIVFEIDLQSYKFPITFADTKVKAICVENWDTDEDGELSRAEAVVVTSLGDVFKGNTEITSFDELQYFTGLTSIGASAFQNCTGLTSVTIPNSVTSIGNRAFEACNSLTSVTIPNSVTNIGGNPFPKCSGLTSIIVEEGNANYDSRDNCNAIIETATNKLISGCKNTIIPEGITTIGGWSFSFCSELASINIPNGVTRIEMAAFENCYALSSVTIPSSVTIIEGYAFSYCCNLPSVTIPNSVTNIGEMAFNNCHNFTSIAIPNSVTSIGGSAFFNCNNLTTVIVDIDSPLTIDENTFSNRSNATLYVPAGTTAAYEAADYWKEFGSIVEISLQLTKYHKWDGCSATATVTEEDGGVEINLGTPLQSGNLLYGRNDVIYLYYADLTDYESLTIKGTPGLQLRMILNRQEPVEGGDVNGGSYIELLSTIDDNGKGVFSFADYPYVHLNAIKLHADSPSGTITCLTLNKGTGIITFADTKVEALCVQHWDTDGDGKLSRAEAAAVTSLSDVFTDNKEITSFDELRYFTGLTELHQWGTVDGCSFNGCTALKSITIPANVTMLYGASFGSCTSLEQISVHPANTKYESPAGCNAIIEKATNRLVVGCETTHIPDGITTIGNAAFWGRWGMQRMIIPGTVTTIEDAAFAWCVNLTSITLPASISAIGDIAFSNCNALTSVRCYMETPPTITEDVFTNRTNATLYVPEGSKAAYEAADYWKEFGSIVEMVISPQLTMYHKWDGCSATASVTEEDGRGEINLGTPLQGYNLLYGRNDVIYLYYADLTGYESLTIEGTPGMKLRVLLNRQEPVEGGDPNGGAFIEQNPTIGDDGKVTVSFSDYEFVHLNAIKLHVDSPSGIITSLTLTEKGQEEPVDPNNMLYAEEKTGRSGASVIIPVMLKTEQFYAGANFSVTLPEGFTLTKVKEEDLLTDHNITFQKTGEKTWTIFVYSTQRSQFSTKEGALLKLKVGVDNDIETGTYAMRLSNIVVSDLNLSENNLANSNSQIIINNSFGKLGDATNDGRRNVTDIMAVINYIFKIPVNNFNEIAADVNGDGDVNVTDIMGIVNLAFEEAAQNAQNSRALRYDYKTIEPE